jgi:MFS family permease
MFDFGIKSRNLKVLFLSFFLAGTLFFLPILALYFQESLFTVTNVSIVLSTLAASMMIFEVPSGVISDLFGRRNTMILSYILLFVSLLFLYFGSSMLAFCTFAVIKAASRSLSSGTDKAIIYETLKAEGQEKLFKKATGLYHAAWAIGGSIGSFVGGLLAVYSLSLPVLVSLFPVGIAVIAIFFLEEIPFEKSENKKMHAHTYKAIKTILKNRQLFIIAASGIILMGFGASMHQLRAIFLEFKEIPIAYFGIISSVGYGLTSVGFAGAHYLAQKIGDKATLILATTLFPLVFLVAVFSGPIITGIAMATAPLFFGLRNPIMDHLVNEEIDSSQRATIMSINSLLNQLGLSTVLILMGYWMDHSGIQNAYLLASCILIIAPVAFLFIKDDPNTTC